MRSIRILKGIEEKLPSHSPRLCLDGTNNWQGRDPRQPGKEALSPSCPPVFKYHIKTLERHLQLLLDIATGILDHQTQDLLGKLLSAMLHEALR